MAFDLSTIWFFVVVLTNPADLFCIFLVISLTVNLEFGYTGIPNFGKVLFVTVGAFFAGSLSYRFMAYIMGLKAPDILLVNTTFLPKIDTFLTNNPLAAIGLALLMLVIGGVLGGVVGFLSSYPAIRLREDYLGMLLLASGEFFNLFGQSYYPLLGGTQGITSPSPLFDLGTLWGIPNQMVLIALALFAVAVYLYAERVGRSPLGRMLRAVRDNEIASEALGKDNVAIRRNVLIVGSALSGMAGVMYLFVFPYIQPGTVGTFTRQTFTFIPFVIVILGGVSNNRGVLLGTVLYVLIIESFSQIGVFLINQRVPIDQALIGRIEQGSIGVVLILILLRRPQGIIPEKATLTMSRSKLSEIAGRLTGRLAPKPEVDTTSKVEQGKDEEQSPQTEQKS